MKSKRIVTCSHNDDQDVMKVLEDISGRLPDGYSAIILPDEGDHPAAIVPKGLIPQGDLPPKLMMTTEAMFALIVSKMCHDQEFMEHMIKECAGDFVQTMEDGELH